MKSNVGSTDRLIRVLLAIVLTVLYLTDIIQGTTGLVLMIVGWVLGFTGMIRFCPLYALLKLNTNKG